MELTANESEAYLVGCQLKNERKGIGRIFDVHGRTHQLHMHRRQYTRQGYNTGQKHIYIKP